MSQELNYAAMRDELRGLGVTIAEFCARAKIDTSTWQRGARGDYEPRRATERRIRAALESLRAERGRGPPPSGPANDAGAADAA